MNLIKIIKYIFFLILLIVLSCDEHGLIINCSDCSSDEPKTATIEIKLDRFKTSSYSATVKIYKGNIEDSILIVTFQATEISLKYSVTINEKYTFTATYTTSYGENYIAVDSAYPRVRYETDQCDEPCYFVYDKAVNLRIKYTR
jgi:hypothetical protein